MNSSVPIYQTPAGTHSLWSNLTNKLACECYLFENSLESCILNHVNSLYDLSDIFTIRQTVYSYLCARIIYEKLHEKIIIGSYS